MQKFPACKRSYAKAECIAEHQYVQEIIKFRREGNTKLQKLVLFSTFTPITK